MITVFPTSEMDKNTSALIDQNPLRCTKLLNSKAASRSSVFSSEAQIKRHYEPHLARQMSGCGLPGRLLSPSGDFTSEMHS